MRVPLLSAAVASALLAGLTVAQAPAEKSKGRPTKMYFGSSECARCHRTPLPNEPAPLLCRCTEVVVWEKDDKHRDAFRVLGEPRALEMARALGFADATKEKSCLACHGVDTVGAAVHRSFKAEEGVTCAVCHGPYKEWVDKHGGIDREEWRNYKREDKERTFGMTDLWDPVRRTQLCASCHVGNRAEGKFVTHAMYAAGHPPLPSFEVATFSDAMPRHWQYLSEKPPEAQKLLSYDPARRERSALVAVGGLVTFREAMRLLAADARVAAEAGTGLDLAHFDCTACHHDLRSPSWRQRRGFGAAPGRPRAHEWPAALLGDTDLGLGELRRAFGARPLGDPKAVAVAAEKLAAWADAAAARKGALTTDEARRLLRDLATPPPGQVDDYDSARQRAWALRVVDLELDPAGSPRRPTIASLTKELRLDLPSGRARQILEELPEALRARADYDPQVFRKRLAEIGAR